MGEIVRFRGKRVCRCVAISIPFVEKEMKRTGAMKGNVWLTQGGYNKGGVAASAGTHDGGGVIDVPAPTNRQLIVWRRMGWEMQRRTRSQGFSSDHGHGVLKGCPHRSRGANYQASEWNRGRNGLRGRGPITGPGEKGKATPDWKTAIRRWKAARAKR